MIKRIERSVFVYFVALFLTFTLYAQNSTLRGQVVDELGAVIPNAEITLTGKDGKQRKAKSSYIGEFSIPNVPAGTYTLTSAYKGFQTAVIEDLKMPQGSSQLTVQMAIAAVEVVTDVSVNNTAVSVEPDQNMNATVLGEEFIQNLPDNEDDLRDFLNALAGGGANGQGATILVDGFQGGRLPPKEAIARIIYNQSPFSAEYSNPGIGRMEIITKPGYGTWRGSGSFSYRNAALDARNAFALKKPDLTQQRYDFNIGGPILKKRLSASLFANRSDSDGSNTTVATTLEGPFVENVPTKSISNYFGGRADYLINNKNTLNMSYNYRTSESANTEFASRFGGGFGGGGFGGGGFGGGGGGGGGGSNLLPERGSDRENSSHNLRLSENWIINARMLHESRLQYQRERSNQLARTDDVAINVLDSFQGGGSTCCPNRSNSDSIEFQDYLTVTLKKHTIKGGIQFEYERISDLSGSNFNGTYTFSSLDQYRAALTAVGNPDPPALARATQFSVNVGDPVIKYDLFRGSWFVQDDFRFRQSLTMSFGLRHEFQTHLVDKLNFAPRVGIAWSPFKDRKTTIRTGGGIFYDRLGGGTYANTLRFDGSRQRSYLIRNAIFNPNFNPDNLSGLGPDVQVQSQVRRILDPNLLSPYSINFNAIVERQLPRGLVATFTYIYDVGIHQFRTRNINAPYPDPNDPTRFIRPNPNEGIIYQTESSARSETNRLMFGLNRRMVSRFTLFGNYSLVWAKSNGEGTPANNYDLRNEWGRSSFDRRHSVFVGGFINLPKGFRLNTFVNASTGNPFNITTGFDENRDGSINDRPLGIGRNSNLPANLYSQLAPRLICVPGSSPVQADGGVKCRLTGTGQLSDQVLLSAFLASAYPNGVFAQGPGVLNVNATLSKSFGFGKRNGLQAQADQGGGTGDGAGGRGGRGGPGGGGRDGPGGGGGGRGGPGGGGGGRGDGGGPGGGGGGFGGGGRGPGMIRGDGPGGMVMIGGGPGGNAESSRYTVSFEISATNVINRVNFFNYSGTLGSAFFGRSSGSAPARQLDLRVRFNF